MGDAFGAVLFGLLLNSLSNCHNRMSGYGERCRVSCVKRGEIHSRDNGVCTCRDGTVWIWQEGYSRRLGAKP